MVDVNEVECLYRPATVCSPAQFKSRTDAGDDIYLCEYLYDMVWQRFRRIEDQHERGAFHAALDDVELWNADEEYNR
jgi:hypothetical protein